MSMITVRLHIFCMMLHCHYDAQDIDQSK